jgi:hypothetical protein
MRRTLQWGDGGVNQRKRASRSFLKKRTKKLLSVTGTTQMVHLNRRLEAFIKVFCSFFFKKEVLLSFCVHDSCMTAPHPGMRRPRVSVKRCMTISLLVPP